MQIYALRSDKRNCLMSFHFESNNEGDFCNDTTCILSSSTDNMYDQLWLSQNKEVAEKIAALGSTNWYNSSFLCPKWDEKYYGKLKVVIANDIEG